MSKWQTGDSWLHYNYREDISYVYINIPKNASSWMKENFGGYLYDWQANVFKASVNSAITLRRGLRAVKHYVVILREPIDRWITGFAQRCWGGDPRDPNFYLNMSPDQWFDSILDDDHTRPQVQFISGLDHSAVTWFDCDSNLTALARGWITQRFDQTVNDPGDAPDNGHNLSAYGKAWPDTGVTQQQIIDHIDRVLSDRPDYVERLSMIYHKDLELRQSVEFYGSR